MRPFVKLIAARLAAGVMVLFCVSILVFVATQALPSDPAMAILGRSATPEGLATLRQQLHLNDPAWLQYLKWITGIFHGDLGLSVGEQARRPVIEIIGPQILNSALLMLIASVVAIPLAILIGVVSGLKRDRAFDNVTSLVSLILADMPEFVIGVGLIFVLATGRLKLFPAVSFIDPDVPLLQQLFKLVLPAMVLVLAVTPYVARMMRASVIEVLESDYIEMARLKGLSPRYILSRHVLPNAIVPTISVLALQFAYLAGSVVVVESVFSYPGIGSGLAEAVANRDLPTIQALTMFIGCLYVILNLVADILTIIVSPRLRVGYRE